MTTEPVTPAMLADALREAIDDADESILYYEARTDVAGYTAKNDWHVVVRVAKERRDRWQGILGRYDAQGAVELRAMMNLAIAHRDKWIEHARMAKNWEWAPHFVKSDVGDARSNNWTYIRLRRQLRALGGES